MSVAAAPSSMFQRALGPPERARLEVSAWQRARMLDAVVREVAEQGYADVTVADIVGRAGVSRRTFYEHFEDKQTCFLAAYQSGVELLVGRILERTGEVPDAPWRVKLRAGLDAYTRELAAEPQFSRTLLLDVQGAGERAIELRQGLFELFVLRFHNLSEQAAEQEPGFVPVPDLFLRALVGGINEVVQQHILRRGAETLDELTPDLVQIAETVIESGGRRA
jgi:AcrR family transcriptional regulator